MKGLESGQWRCALSASNGGRGREQRECLWYEGQRYLLPRACKTIGEGITEGEKEQHFHSGLSNSKANYIVNLFWLEYLLNSHYESHELKKTLQFYDLYKYSNLKY